MWKDTKLSPAYTPFGRVTHGMATLRRIAAAGDDEQLVTGIAKILTGNMPVRIFAIPVTRR